MIWMLVIADDITGALDTGVQFAKRGILTKVGGSGLIYDAELPSDLEVLVINANTRHLKSEEAYHKVKVIVLWATEKQIPIIFKKTDSVLRGNVGSELSAVVENGVSNRIYFIPAFPKMKRYTLNATQYIDNIPLEETHLGKDLFEPISSSYLPRLIKQQSACKIRCVGRCEKLKENWFREDEKTIYICDAFTEQDIPMRIAELRERGELRALAGCAGFAEHLAEIHQKKVVKVKGNTAKGILISCGSLNTVTKAQLDYLQKKGKPRVHLTKEMRMTEEKGGTLINELRQLILKQGVAVLDTFSEDGEVEFAPKWRFEVAKALGKTVKELVDCECIDTMIITGGDTLMGLLRELGCSGINPIGELQSGVVLSELVYQGKTLRIISKSGGFGKENLIHEILRKIKK